MARTLWAIPLANLTLAVMFSQGCSNGSVALDETRVTSSNHPSSHVAPHVVFTAPPTDPSAIPLAENIQLPEVDAPKSAIWGATGRDAAGHIWLGVSVERESDSSARLMMYTPGTDCIQDCGNVLDALRSAGLYRSGESQMKIHTRLIERR